MNKPSNNLSFSWNFFSVLRAGVLRHSRLWLLSCFVFLDRSVVAGFKLRSAEFEMSSKERCVLSFEKELLNAFEEASGVPPLLGVKLNDSSEALYLMGESKLSKGDIEAAIACFEAASAGGKAEASYQLAALYYLGRNGVEKDLCKAASYFETAANQGYVGAYYNMALLSYAGAGVPQDYSEAVKWFKKTVALGAQEESYVSACFELGDIYYMGKGVAKNVDVAAQYYQMAVDQGHYKAYLRLAYLKYAGLGVPQDREAAVGLFKVADAHGVKGAAHALEEIQKAGESPKRR